MKGWKGENGRNRKEKNRLVFFRPKQIIILINCVFATNFDFLIQVRSNNRSLIYQRFTPSGSKDIGIRILEFVQRLNFFPFFWSSYLFLSKIFPLKEENERKR